MLTGMALIESIRNEKAEPPSGIVALGLDVTHKWIEAIEPGHAVLVWKVDPHYFNLEGAVICSWTVALADQAIFFAASSVCETGESTRMRALSAEFLENMSGGTLRISATVDRRVDDTLHCTCRFDCDGRMAAEVSAKIDIFRD